VRSPALIAFVAAALAFPLVAPRFAPRPEPALVAALGRATGLPPERVALGRFTVAPPGAVIFEELRLGPLRVERVSVAIDLWAFAGGEKRARRLEADGLRLETSGGALSAARLTALLDGRRRGRATLEAIDGRLAGVAVQAPRAELERRAGTLRLLVPSARAAGLSALAIVAAAGPDGVALRARRGDLTFTARRRDGRWEARLRLSGLPLDGAAALLPPPLAVTAGRVSGEIELGTTGRDGEAAADLRIEGLVFSHPALGRAPIGPLDAALAGQVDRAGEAGRLRVRSLRLGGLELAIDGSWAAGPRVFARAQLQPLPCAVALRALPRSLLPTLDGLALDGELAGSLELDGRASDLAHLEVRPHPVVGCRVAKDAPLADPRPLRDRQALVRAGGERGRSFVLDPAGADWAPLETIPDAVVRTFVLAEDAQFFTHHGFDEARLGRALGANLAEGRLGRGASTISQQVAKNLFLSGERSLGRKLEEAVLTWRLEQLLDKRRILEVYLNLVELGPGVRGIRAAAAHHFAKPVEALDEADAARLAALLPAPQRGFDAAWQRRHAALVARLPDERLTLPWQRTRRPLKLSRVSARGVAARPR
jgi:monofunctional biosynthetic peptidoglycan transglycosylase